MIDAQHTCYVTRSSFPYIYLFSHLFINASIALASLRRNHALPRSSYTYYLFALQMWEFVRQMFEGPLLLGQKWWTGVTREHDRERAPPGETDLCK